MQDNRPKTHVERITKEAQHSGIFDSGTRHTQKSPSLDMIDTVACLECGKHIGYTQGTCPHCGYVEFK